MKKTDAKSKTTKTSTHTKTTASSMKMDTQPSLMKSDTTQSHSHVSAPVNDKRRAIIIAAICLLALAFYIKRDSFIAAKVNGTVISRAKLVQTLEKQAGKQALEGLITQELIRQEAKKQNIKIEQADVDKEIKLLEDQLKERGQNLDDFLELQGISEEDLRDQAELQLILEKLVAKDTVVTKAEVDETVKEQLAEAKKQGTKDIDEKEIRVQVENGLKAQKQSEAIQNWVKTALENAKISRAKEFDSAPVEEEK